MPTEWKLTMRQLRQMLRLAEADGADMHFISLVTLDVLHDFSLDPLVTSAWTEHSLHRQEAETIHDRRSETEG